MNKAKISKKIAHLESVNDHLETELSAIDRLLRLVGFPQGLASAKEIGQEMLQSMQEDTKD